MQAQNHSASDSKIQVASSKFYDKILLQNEIIHIYQSQTGQAMNEVAIPAQTTHALTLKGNLFTLTVVYLNTTDLFAIGDRLQNLIASTPKFFENAPVVLDCSQLANDHATVAAFDLPALQRLFKQYRLILVGMRTHTDEHLNQLALGTGLALLPAARTKYESSYGYRVKQAQASQQQSHTSPNRTSEESLRVADDEASEPPSEENDARDADNAESKNKGFQSATKIIHEPVRSGQQIYAKGGDLIILSSVSHGAEVLADGNIHVYGTLSGRALAGVQGNSECRIFCKKLDAELIAIAGHYRVKEDIGTPPKAALLDIHLLDNKLVIEAC